MRPRGDTSSIEGRRDRKKTSSLDLTEFPTQMRQKPDNETGLGGWLISGRNPEDVWRQYTERKATEENGPKLTNTAVPESKRLAGQYLLSGEPQE